MKDYLFSELKAGKYFSRTAFLDENYILLSPETPIDQELMNRLLRWDYTHIYSDGIPTDSQVSSASEGEAAAVVNLNVQLKEKAELGEASNHFRQILEFTDSLFKRFTSGGELSQDDITNTVKVFVDAVKRLRQYILRYSEFASASNYVVTHSVKTAAIGIILGQELRFPPHRNIELGMACLLHEFGMLKLPGQLYMSDKILGEQERKAISAHPVLAFKILKAKNFPMNICLAILESHENVDGSGYPQGLPGPRISQYGKILSVASSYVAMTSERPFRMALDGHHAIVELLKNRDTRYDPVILNTLVRTLSLYPIGTFVKVKSGASGMVIETLQDKPKEPTVRLLQGPQGETYKESPIVNTSNAGHQIVGTLPPHKAGSLKAALNLNI